MEKEQPQNGGASTRSNLTVAAEPVPEENAPDPDEDDLDDLDGEDVVFQSPLDLLIHFIRHSRRILYYENRWGEGCPTTLRPGKTARSNSPTSIDRGSTRGG